MKKLCGLLGLLLIFLPTLGQANVTVFFKGSDYELEVYRINGHEDGPTLMIMGGIQGDEPGGYLAADLYADLHLKKGNLIVVPRANFYSILVNQRGPNGDMNRKFAKVDSYDPDGEVVKKIKELMEEADYFLNMHDGSGFYHPEYIDSLRNPRRYGQSIIADTDRYTASDGRVFDLAGMANRVIERVNASIHEEDYRYHFNNHNTSANNSRHKEQRKSATYYVLTHLEKPAFASETSKEIKDFRKRVVFQTMVVNAFMDEIGIVPDSPSLYIDPPMMEYALVSVNGATPVAVYDNQRIVVRSGDTVKIEDVKSNYKRGVVADIKGYGKINDTGKEIKIASSTMVDIKKDMFPCGQIFIDIMPDLNRTWLIVEIDDISYAVAPEGVIETARGSVLELKDLIYNGSADHGLNVNFKGFVSNWDDNVGEDRGCKISTAKLLSRYASSVGDGVDRYRISAMRGEDAVVNFYVDIKS